MNKKIIVKALAIAAILVSAVLFFLSIQGVLAGNRTYDLFRKIRVDLKDVYAEMDDYDLDHVKNTYREAFAVVDQIDAVGGAQAQNYMNDVVQLYGLLDTVEVTDDLKAAVDEIGTREAWKVLGESFNEIDQAGKAFNAVKAAGAENAAGYLTDIESALEELEDPAAARERVDADYGLNEDTGKMEKEQKDAVKKTKEFFDFVFAMVQEKGGEETLPYLKAVADAPDMTNIEFAQQRIIDRYTAKPAEDGESESGEEDTENEPEEAAADESLNQSIRTYANTIFRLASDQGSAQAKEYIQGMLIVASINDIGPEKAQQALDDVYSAIDEAGRVLKAVRTVGKEDVDISISRLETVLKTTDDMKEARKQLDESDTYIYLGKETTKQINALYDFAFEMIEEKGAEETLKHLKNAAGAADQTDMAYAAKLINDLYQGQDNGNSSEALPFCDDVFNLIADRGTKGAKDTFQHLLDAMKQAPIQTSREYLYYVYDDTEENQKTRSYLDAIFRMMDAEGMQYVKENGGNICADLSSREAVQVQEVLDAVDAVINSDAAGDPSECVSRIIDTVDAIYETSGGSDNQYLADLNKILEDARGRRTSGGGTIKAKRAATLLDQIREATAGVRNVTVSDQMDQARNFQNDAWALMNQIGLERARKYIEYASSKAYDDKTLRLDQLGTDNVEKLEALNTTDMNRIRDKSRNIVLAVACLIIGITLLCIKLNGNRQPRMSRKERQQLGTHMGLKTSRMIANSAIHAVLVVISVVWLIPFVSIVLQSLRVESTWQVGYIMPTKLGFYNYIDLFDTDFPRWYLNTFIMALVVAVLQTVIVLCMSYTLSRFRFKMRKPLMRLMLILGMFPGMLSMIILYRVLKDLGLTQTNAVPGLILVYVASSGMGYYVSKGFFDTIPKSLDEAARVDGATRAQVLYKIILPLAKPIVIYTILTAFMGPWGDYVFARYISFGTSKGMNVAVGLYSWLSKDQIASRYTMFCAGGVLVAIPVAVLFMCLQKYYVEGVTGGAVKG